MSRFNGAPNSDDTLRRMIVDLPFFAQTCLRVRNKAGEIVPFLFNAPQFELHAQIEAQKARTGMVRALASKGRQQGVSTYVAARFYQRTALSRGVNTFILAHDQPASDNLFNIVDRYQRYNPLPPHIGASNIKELEFDLLESSYSVGTAGAKAAGRGKTTTLFHGSEVAFWANAQMHFASSVQTVPMEPGTEIILESTSNGAAGEWYERAQDAIKGVGDYILIFLPWFLTPEYRREPPPGFELDDSAESGEMSEAEYATTFDLTLGQMAWRRSKIAELRSKSLFMQEYPSTVYESFQSVGHEPLIAPLLVLRARKRTTDGGQSPLILGVDPASNGGDRFSVAARRGPQVPWVKHRNKIDVQEGAQWINALIDEHNPARVNIDLGHIGQAIYTLVRAMSRRNQMIVRGVNFGSPSQFKMAYKKRPGPANRRAEMWDRSREWLESEEGASIPDDEALQADATAPKKKPQLNGDFILESKADMKARGKRSPDLWDSVALTFASNEFLTGAAAPPKRPDFGTVDRASPVGHGLPEFGGRVDWTTGGGGGWMAG